MQKKAVTLIEVIFSVLLISVVIITLLSTHQNNLHIIEHTAKQKHNLQYVNAVAAIPNQDFKRNNTIYLTDLYSTQDDQIRQKLKEQKFIVKDELFDTKKFNLYGYPLSLKIYKSLYTSKENQDQKYYYGITLEQ